jgi:flagellar export protein FliJ
MKRFQFRLQTALEHRQRKEKLATLDYGAAQGQLDRAMILLQELEDAQDAIIKELGDRRLSGQFDPNETKLYHEYLNTVRQCIAEQQVYIADLTSTAEALRLNLVLASQQRQVLDTMRSKAQSDHVIAANKHEQLTSDDMTASRRVYQQQQASQE